MKVNPLASNKSVYLQAANEIEEDEIKLGYDELEVAFSMPSRFSVKTMIYENRMNRLTIEPTSLENVVITCDWTITYKNLTYLLVMTTKDLELCGFRYACILPIRLSGSNIIL